MTDKPVWPRVRFAAAQFIVIVAGVLVALAVDEWRQSRQDRDLELLYASRLRLDLQRDTSRFGDFERSVLATKAAVLMGLKQRASHPATGSAGALGPGVSRSSMRTVSAKPAVRVRRERPGAPAYNNAVGASARCARSGVHGAYGARAREQVGWGSAGHSQWAFVLAPRRQPLNVI